MAIQQLQQHFEEWKNRRLVDVLFEEEPPGTMLSQVDHLHPDKLVWVNDSLNVSQRQAISTCLISRDISMIHGPPGTGKTTTVVEFII